MSSEITMWHYSIDGEKLGPVSTPELRRLASIGQIAPTDLVWKDGMTDWIPASRIKDLFPAGASGKPRANAPSGDGTGVSPTALITEGAGKMTEGAGKMLEHVGRFSTQMHDISSSMFQSEAGAERDNHPAIFVREKYFGGCIQKGMNPNILHSLGSTILTILFSWVYLIAILYQMGAAWQFLPFHRTEFLSVRLRRRVRPAVIVPAIITWVVQVFAVSFVLYAGLGIAALVAAKLEIGAFAAMAGLIALGLSALWYAICNYTALKLIRGLDPDTLFDYQAVLEYGYPRKVALIRGTSGASVEQQLEGVLALCEKLSTVEFSRWDQVTTHGRDGLMGGIWNRVQNLGL